MLRIDAPGAAPVRWLLDILDADPAHPVDPLADRLIADLALVVSPYRARFLVPAGPPRVTAATLHTYNRLRPRRVAAVRWGLAAAARLGATSALRHHVRVHASAADGSEDLAQRWLPERLRRVLGVPTLHFAVGLSPNGRFAKPTLQLFDGRGGPIGYAKIGWNEATRASVAREAEVLAAWPERAGVRVPTAIHSETWQGRVVSISAPLARSVRRVPVRRWPCTDGMEAVVRSASRGTHPLGAADWVAPALAVADGSAGRPEHQALQEAARLLRAEAAVELPHGLAHGDWVPWNLAVDGDDLVAWDWEHAIDDAPLGLDLVHWAYQQRVVVEGQGPEAGFEQGLVDARPALEALGLDDRQIRAVGAAHRLQLVAREAGPG